MVRHGRTRKLAPARGLGLPGALSILAACSGPPGAGRQLGDDLGGFHVAATELTNGCGAGALGSRTSFDFDIDLARGSTQIFWGQEASGPLDAQLGFEFSAALRVSIGPNTAPNENDTVPNDTVPDDTAANRAHTGGVTSAGCTIARADHVTGTLQPDANGEVLGFKGTLSYSFAPAQGSTCSLDDRIAAGLPRLPCEMDYALAADRTRTPD
jgi:hypothetical protein